MDKCWSPFGSRNWNLDKPGAGTYHDWSEIAHRWAWKAPPTPCQCTRRFFQKTFFLIVSPVQLPHNGFWQNHLDHVTECMSQGLYWTEIEETLNQTTPTGGIWFSITSRREFHVVGQARWLVVFESSIPFHSTAPRSTQKNSPSHPRPPLPHPGCVNQHPHWYHGKNPQNPFKLLYLNITNIPYA
jgi:hypothetical protein